MNLQELKKTMNTVPDHKMNHGKPMKGPIRDKKEGMAQKMGKQKIPQRKISFLSESQQKEVTKNWPKGEYKTPSSDEQHKHQSRIGRAYND